MNNKLNYRVVLAPMAGVTDYSFRAICRSFGAEYTYTEMISAKAIHYEDKKTALIGRLYSGEEPISVQIFGSDPDIMSECAAKVAENSYKYCKSDIRPTAIDINMGCPAPKVSMCGDGSALLKNPVAAAEIVRSCIKAAEIPVTVKMRIGWDSNSVCGVEFAKRMEDAGAFALTVHGRTREGRFSAPIDYDEIRRIKDAVSVPVIGNGDIFTASDALRMFELTGCDAVMVGRGSLGNPWIFSEITAKLDGRDWNSPGDDEKISTALSELRSCIAEKGERMGVLESRKRLAWYLKGIQGAAGAKDAINTALTYDEIEAIMSPLKTKLI